MRARNGGPRSARRRPPGYPASNWVPFRAHKAACLYVWAPGPYLGAQTYNPSNAIARMGTQNETRCPNVQPTHGLWYKGAPNSKMGAAAYITANRPESKTARPTPHPPQSGRAQKNGRPKPGRPQAASMCKAQKSPQPQDRVANRPQTRGDGAARRSPTRRCACGP